MNTLAVRVLSVIAAVPLAVAIAGPAAATNGRPRAGAPPPGRVIIDLVTVNGAGCQPGTAQIRVAPDNTSFIVTFSDLRVRVGGASGPRTARKDCQLNLLVHHPPGYQFAINRVEYEGYTFLASQAVAMLRTDIRFQGVSSQATLVKRFWGPLDEYWRTMDEVPEADLTWSPCNAVRLLNIKASVTAASSNPDVTSLLDVAPDALFGLDWRTCP